MLNSQACTAALALARKMYLQLSEVLDITRETLEALSRRDQVSVQMFLGMRQEQINQLCQEQDALRRQCRSLPEEAAVAMRQILNGQPSDQPEARDLCQQVAKNRDLLERTLQADQILNRRLAGEKSFYQK